MSEQEEIAKLEEISKLEKVIAFLDRNVVELAIGITVVICTTVLGVIKVLTPEQVYYIFLLVLGYIFGRAHK